VLQPATAAPRQRWWSQPNGQIVVAVLAWIAAVLLLDHGLGPHGASVVQQRLLGVGTWLLLIALLVREPIRIRAQVGVVVAFATLIEYTFSYELHVYIYRLHNVPWFVPPGHGLVYLGALAIGRSPAVTTRARILIPLTLLVAGLYAGWGLFLSGRHDVLGVLWFGCLTWFLLRGRQPTVFIGAFVVVTYLELLGTHLGIWTWQARDPVAHLISMGNPPSGAAGGYGFFDAAALALAPRIDAALARRRGRRGQGVEHGVVQQPVAAHHAAAVGASES
jgi:hypothetical protein